MFLGTFQASAVTEELSAWLIVQLKYKTNEHYRSLPLGAGMRYWLYFVGFLSASTSLKEYEIILVLALQQHSMSVTSRQNG